MSRLSINNKGEKEKLAIKGEDGLETGQVLEPIQTVVGEEFDRDSWQILEWKHG